MPLIRHRLPRQLRPDPRLPILPSLLTPRFPEYSHALVAVRRIDQPRFLRLRENRPGGRSGTFLDGRRRAFRDILDEIVDLLGAGGDLGLEVVDVGTFTQLGHDG